MDWAAFFSGLAPVVVALIGWQGWQRLFGAKRENAEALSLTQDVWANEFRRLEQDAERARARADAAERRADEVEAHARRQDLELVALNARIDDILDELADLRLRERVLVEALVENGIEPNGWVERRMRQIERQEQE